MKIAGFASGIFLLLGVYGILAGFPGICGNAFPLLPASWDGRYDTAASVMGCVSFALSFIMGVFWFVLMTRRQTIQATNAIRIAQESGDNGSI